MPDLLEEAKRSYIEQAQRIIPELVERVEQAERALRTADEALRDARNGLDLGLGFARDHANDHAVHPKDRWTRQMDEHLARARTSHAIVREALAAQQREVEGG